MIAPSLDATAHMQLPPIPLLVGVTYHVAFLTLRSGAPSGVNTISQPLAITIQP